MLTAYLQQVGERVVKGATAVLKEGAEAIAEKAKSNAPVDTHGLEEAIKVERVQARSADGRFGSSRVGYNVYVDFNSTNEKGKSIGEYAWRMHALLAPYGSGAYNLGEASQAKAAAGHDVGGLYLERAVIDYKPAIVERIQEIAMRATNK